jgi:hypothetical protein
LNVLCAIGPRREHLMTCDWGARYHHATVRFNAETSGLRMAIPTGVVLRFRVSDPLSRFGISPSHRLGVRSERGVYKRASLVSRTGGVAEFALAVPRRSALRLYVAGGSGLSDATGIPLPNGQLSVRIDSGDQPEKVIDLVAR